MTAFPRAQRRARKTAAKLFIMSKTRASPCFMLDYDHAVVVPGYKLVSRANARMHWRKMAKLSKAQRFLGLCIGRRLTLTHPKPPATLTLTRHAPRKLDSDNIASAFKSVRDGIADAYGVDDSESGPITWLYAQRPGDYAIEVTAT